MIATAMIDIQRKHAQGVLSVQEVTPVAAKLALVRPMRALVEAVSGVKFPIPDKSAVESWPAYIIEVSEKIGIREAGNLATVWSEALHEHVDANGKKPFVVSNVGAKNKLMIHLSPDFPQYEEILSGLKATRESALPSR